MGGDGSGRKPGVNAIVNSFKPQVEFGNTPQNFVLPNYSGIQDAAKKGSGIDLTTAVHTRQHAITQTLDHTSTATAGRILKANADGLPIDATNTDAQVSAAVTASHGVNDVNTSSAAAVHTHALAAGATDVTSSAAELNVLDGIPATLTATEIGYCDGVTSAIQTQLDNCWTCVKKTAIESVNNSSVMQDDAHLFFSVAANSVYHIDLMLWGLLKTASDFKWAFTVPAAATITRVGMSAANTQVAADSTAANLVNVGSDAEFCVRNLLRLVTGANAGTCQLQWAQDAAVAENTSLETGSTLRYIKVV
jgi:hypothetical protein